MRRKRTPQLPVGEYTDEQCIRRARWLEHRFAVCAVAPEWAMGGSARTKAESLAPPKRLAFAKTEGDRILGDGWSDRQLESAVARWLAYPNRSNQPI